MTVELTVAVVSNIGQGHVVFGQGHGHMTLFPKKPLVFPTATRSDTNWAREARWPSGRASRGRGWGLDPHSGRHVVSLSKIHFITGNKLEGDWGEIVALKGAKGEVESP